MNDLAITQGVRAYRKHQAWVRVKHKRTIRSGAYKGQTVDKVLKRHGIPEGEEYRKYTDEIIKRAGK